MYETRIIFGTFVEPLIHRRIIVYELLTFTMVSMRH